MEKSKKKPEGQDEPVIKVKQIAVEEVEVSKEEAKVIEKECFVNRIDEPASVTNHAVLRYLERKEGIKVERIRKDILKACKVAIDMGANAVNAHGISYKIKGRKVTTVI